MRACAGGFVEASSGPIDLSIDDANALGAVIKYFYTGEYPISRSFEGVDPYLRPSEPELLEDPMHVLSAYILTDKYNVESLTRLTAVLCLRLAKRSKYSVAFST